MNANWILPALLAPALILIVLSALGLTACAQTPLLLDTAYLESLRAEVRTNHPSVAAARARLLAAEVGVRTVRQWEDPSAGLGVMAAERNKRRDDGDILVVAEQALPRRRLYEARKARATAERFLFEAETRSAELSLETLVVQAAVELALVDEMLAIQTIQLAWLESMAANAREKLKDPKANVSESFRIESEVAQERQKIDSAQRQRVRLAQQLNILFGRTAESLWPVLRLQESASLTPALTGELSRLVAVNPSLQALLNNANIAKSEIEVVKRERSPVFSVGVESSLYSGGDFRQATVGAKMTFPWVNNSIYRANTERARHRQVAAERDVEALGRKLRGEAIAAHTEAETSAHQAGTISKEVIPRAHKAAESTQNAWISSRASLLDVLESQRSLFNARLEERRFVAAHRAALETLRSIVPPTTHP
ncbi:MAG: TolC family protein [Pedosphaera sp.]|nr:TolC family protein [Pedosphaera sp.]